MLMLYSVLYLYFIYSVWLFQVPVLRNIRSWWALVGKLNPKNGQIFIPSLHFWMG